MRFALAICCISLVALTCTGCLASKKYEELARKYNSIAMEFNDKAKGRDGIWKGEYLGIESECYDDHRPVHYYQFQGLMEGEERTLHFILPVDDYKKAYAVEWRKIESPNAQPAWLVLAENRSKEELEKIAKDIQEQCPQVAKPNILYLKLYLVAYGWFRISMDPETASDVKRHDKENEWQGQVIVTWRARSGIMQLLRFAYSNAVALAYVPVDAALLVTSPVWCPMLILCLRNPKW